MPYHNVFTWLEADAAFIPDPCDEDNLIFTGSTFIANYTITTNREGIRFDGWDLKWWLAELWPPEAPPVTDFMRVTHFWIGPMTRPTMQQHVQGFDVDVRAVDSCELAMTIHGQVRWVDGEPVPRDPSFGSQPPELIFADTELGRTIQQMMAIDDDG